MPTQSVDCVSNNIENHMSTRLNIHPELQSIKAHKMPMNRGNAESRVRRERGAPTQVQVVHHSDHDPKFRWVRSAGSGDTTGAVAIACSSTDLLPRGGAFVMKPAPRLAPAHVKTAEFDLLHDQGDAYAHALMGKGVEVDMNEIKGGVHGFDLLAPNSSPSKDAMQRRIQCLRRVFG